MVVDMSKDTDFNRGDPVIGVHRTYPSSNIAKGVWSNTQGYNNPRVDELLATAAEEDDAEKRKAFHAAFQEIVNADVLQYFPNALPYHFVFSDRVGNTPIGI